MYRKKTIFILLFIFCAIFYLSNCQQKTVIQQAPEGFEIHPDFRMELVASEPLVLDPVDIKFDEAGNAYVLEMPGYPLSDEASRLVLLEDKDKDGIYDERQVFADGLGVASSFMPYKKGFLVAAPPDLVYLEDTNGDGTANTRQIHLSGFEVGNLQHNYNGLTYGLDNWIYAANGGNNGKPFFPQTPDQILDLRGQDFRFRLEERQLERVGESSGGFELAFDNWGNMYETHNLEHVSQLVFEGKYIEGLPVDPAHSLTVISDHEENGLSRIYPIGVQDTRVNHPEQSGYFSGSCGITFYGGNRFPEGFNNNLFVADVVLNLIHLDVLSPDKSAFKTSRMRDKVEFIASSDRSFRPVNLSTGPDGALYLVDMYREVIEHPEWIPDEIEKDMDLAAGKEKGRIYRIIPANDWQPDQPALVKASPKALVEALGNQNQWTRMTAQRLLVSQKNQEAIEPLEESLKNADNELARLHGLWTLEGLGKLQSTDLKNALLDPNPGVRQNALKIAEPRLDENPALIDQVIALTDDRNARVRLQAALCLSRLSPTKHQERQITIHQALSKMLLNKETDQWIAMAVAAAAKNQPIVFIDHLIGSTQPLNPYQLQVLSTLGRLVGSEQKVADIQQVLNSLSQNTSLNPSDQSAIIEALASDEAGKQEISGNQRNLLSTLQKIETSSHPSVIRACGNLRRTLQLPVSSATQKLIAEARIKVKDSSIPVEERLAFLQLIGLEPIQNRATVLYELLDNRQPLALQEESLMQLWESNDPSIASRLIDLWPSLGPLARQKAGNILLYKTYNHDQLLTALETGKIKMGEMNFDLERRRTLLWWTDSESVKKRAEALFSDAGVVTRKAALEKMRPALTIAGNIEKGKEQFINLCSQCHQYGSIGKNVGPILTEISRKSRESLLHDILDPNAAVDASYINHQAKTKDGNIYTGIISRETDTELSLKMLGGQEIHLKKNELENLSALGISMMPEGQEANMSPEEMADLLAFLQQPVL